MWVIRNIGETDIVLDDLRIILGPGKQIDLDKVIDRHLSEHSFKLRIELARNPARIIQLSKDGNEATGLKVNIEHGQALKQMEQRLSDKMAQTVAAKDREIAELTKAVHSLIKTIKDQPAPVQVVQMVAPAVETSKPAVDTNSSSDDISVDIASRIHAKAVKRMEKDVTGGSIEQEARIQGSDSLLKNLSELENLGNP